MNLPFSIDLKNKVAVITGAGGVLCSIFAEAIAACGAKVALLDLNEAAAETVAERIRKAGGEAIAVKTNCLEKESIEAAKVEVDKAFGPCDILINGAGGNNPRATTDNEYQHEAREGGKSFFDLEASGVDFVFKLNFQGTLLPTQAFAKDMVDHHRRMYP